MKCYSSIDYYWVPFRDNPDIPAHREFIDMRNRLIARDYIRKGIYTCCSVDEAVEKESAFFENRAQDSGLSFLLWKMHKGEKVPISTISLFTKDLPSDSYMPEESKEYLHSIVSSSNPEPCLNEIGRFAANPEFKRLAAFYIPCIMDMLHEAILMRSSFTGVNASHIICVTNGDHAQFYRERRKFITIDKTKTHPEKLNGKSAVYSILPIEYVLIDPEKGRRWETLAKIDFLNLAHDAVSDSYSGENRFKYGQALEPGYGLLQRNNPIYQKEKANQGPAFKIQDKIVQQA